MLSPGSDSLAAMFTGATAALAARTAAVAAAAAVFAAATAAASAVSTALVALFAAASAAWAASKTQAALQLPPPPGLGGVRFRESPDPCSGVIDPALEHEAFSCCCPLCNPNIARAARDGSRARGKTSPSWVCRCLLCASIRRPSVSVCCVARGPATQSGEVVTFPNGLVFLFRTCAAGLTAVLFPYLCSCCAENSSFVCLSESWSHEVLSPLPLLRSVGAR